VTKGKSMISEELAINEHLEQHGITPVETDLGEYILQIRHEPPSHIIGPAFHLNREDWEESFRKSHTDLPRDRVFHERRDILTEARTRLRERFLAADVGITGANFLIAETGSTVTVTNEGNAGLTQTLPRVHVVLVDNGRTGMIGTEFQDMLRCIRCAACMNHCPVYYSVGGHSYGWVYPGPMGAVLTPGLIGVDKAGHLPNASTFCGKCESVCPVKIPLPKMMRHWREREFERHLSPQSARSNIAIWAWFARRPSLYRLVTRAAAASLGLLGRKRGRFTRLPLAGGWTAGRDLPAPEGETFFARYARTQRQGRSV